MMKVPPLSLVGMERLPLPLPFSPELLWRYNPLGGGHPGAPPSPAAAAAAAALSRATGVALPSPLAAQLPFAYDIKHTIPMPLGKIPQVPKLALIPLLASDPRMWTRDDVITFLQWCEREFDLPDFDTNRFQMNGKALCLLTKSDLESRAPCSGDVIHNALQLLMSSCSDFPLTPQTPSMRVAAKGDSYGGPQQNGTTSVTLSPAPSLDGQAGSPPENNGPSGPNHLSSSTSSMGSGGVQSDDSEYDSVGESPERSPGNDSLSPPPNPPSVPAQQKSFGPSTSTKMSSNSDSGEYSNNGRLLWDFLQQLLNDPAQRYSSFIAWKNVETGIFKIVDPPGLARLWGIQKNHLSMNYDKMSRALRYYYRVNILRKVQGERHCYQFLRNPGELKSIKNISMLRHQQNSPISLVKAEPTFAEGSFSEPSFADPQFQEGSFGDSFGDGDYDELPTDLSMDSERHLKEED